MYNNIFLTEFKENLKNCKLENVTKKQVLEVIKNLKQDLNNREFEILENITEIKQNKEVPKDYFILEFYAYNGDGFEAGKTPSGYGITN